MTVKWITAFLDTPSAAGHETETFWLEATGTSPSTGRGDQHQFVTLLAPAGDAFLRAQVTDSNACRVHVDLHVPDVTAAADLARSLDAKITADHGTLVVLHSLAGLPFCLVADHGENVRPGQPAHISTWPAMTFPPRRHAISRSAHRWCGGQPHGRHFTTRRTGNTASPHATHVDEPLAARGSLRGHYPERRVYLVCCRRVFVNDGRPVLR